MGSWLTLPNDELARFQGSRCYQLIVEKYLAAIGNKDWQQQVQELLSMGSPLSSYQYPALSNWEFQVSPGSGAHHTHFGGLALHTLQNLEYAESWATVYQSRSIPVSRDLLFAMIILHDCMKRFIYQFDDQFNLVKAEDPFIAKSEDHHSWVIREMAARGFDVELIKGVAAMHGIDDVSLDSGVTGTAVVNHYLHIGDSHLNYTEDDIRPEHVIGFLADSDWHWSGQAQRKSHFLAKIMAKKLQADPKYLALYLGSRFTFEKIGSIIEADGYEQAAGKVEAMISLK